MRKLMKKMIRITKIIKIKKIYNREVKQQINVFIIILNYY